MAFVIEGWCSISQKFVILEMNHMLELLEGSFSIYSFSVLKKALKLKDLSNDFQLFGSTAGTRVFLYYIYL